MSSSSQVAVAIKEQVVKYFSNVKQGFINDSILVLVTINKDIEDILYGCCKQSRIQPNFIITRIENLTKDFLIQNSNTNLIVIASRGIPIDKTFRGIRKFIVAELKSSNSPIRDSYLDSVFADVITNCNNPAINLSSHANLVFLGDVNPMEVIYCHPEIIKEFLQPVLNDMKQSIYILKGMSYFKGKSYMEIKIWQHTIINDIDFLVAKRKLTCRLARVIYNVAILDDKISTTAVGKFFKDRLLVKSKSLYDKHYGVSNVKGYDLKESQELYSILNQLSSSNYSI